ncbi:MAG: HAD family hydrolase [Methanobacteriota archaeon]
MTAPAMAAHAAAEIHAIQPGTLKAIFLDRDGVINKMYKGDWVRTWEQFVWLPGAMDAVALISKKGYLCAIITNQSCVGRGVVPRETVDDINGRMVAELEKAGGKISGVYVCPHRPDEGCPCRKPGTLNFERAMKDLGVRADEILFVGDNESDREAARRVGCMFEMAGGERTLLKIVEELLA